jgi:SAM-dependent methyltransferase
VTFLRRQLPEPSARVLDLCCGPGRHAAPLSEAGFDVIGLDRDTSALAEASVIAPAAMFVRGDMRELPLASGTVGAAICMWQSFGHFDDAGNAAVLAELARVLVPNGVLVMDLYNREATREGTRLIERDGARIHEARTMRGERLSVHLRYESTGDEDSFDWRLFTPATFAIAARGAGLEMLLACGEFDENVPASGEHARMQLVLEKIMAL